MEFKNKIGLIAIFIVLIILITILLIPIQQETKPGESREKKDKKS